MSAALKLNRKIERWQIIRIHILKKELDLDDDTYRERLEDWTGETSSKDISFSQAVTVIESMEAMQKTSKINITMQLVEKVTNRKSAWVQKPGGLSEAQYGCIMGKSTKLGFTESQLAGFIEHTIKSKVDVLDLKIKQASHVINGLVQKEQGK